MADMDVRAEYQQILHERRDEIQGTDGFRGVELRKHPRLKVQTSDLWISTVPEFALLDMSASGIAIESNHPIQPGEHVHISLGDALSVDAEVIGCRLEQAPDEFTDGSFRIQCHFLEDLLGMELFVKTVRSS